jgi:hypothetical protein
MNPFLLLLTYLVGHAAAVYHFKYDETTGQVECICPDGSSSRRLDGGTLTLLRIVQYHCDCPDPSGPPTYEDEKTHRPTTSPEEYEYETREPTTRRPSYSPIPVDEYETPEPSEYEVSMTPTYGPTSRTDPPSETTRSPSRHRPTKRPTFRPTPFPTKRAPTKYPTFARKTQSPTQRVYTVFATTMTYPGIIGYGEVFSACIASFEVWNLRFGIPNPAGVILPLTCSEGYGYNDMFQMDGVLQGPSGIIIANNTEEFINRDAKYYQEYLLQLSILSKLPGFWSACPKGGHPPNKRQSCTSWSEDADEDGSELIIYSNITVPIVPQPCVFNRYAYLCFAY